MQSTLLPDVYRIPFRHTYDDERLVTKKHKLTAKQFDNYTTRTNICLVTAVVPQNNFSFENNQSLRKREDRRLPTV